MHQLAALSATEQHALERDALADRLIHAAATTFDAFAVYIGDRLGFYQLAAGPLTSAGLALAHTHPRYPRGWLPPRGRGPAGRPRAPALYRLR
jgi:hypothetical protein